MDSQRKNESGNVKLKLTKLIWIVSAAILLGVFLFVILPKQRQATEMAMVEATSANETAQRKTSVFNQTATVQAWTVTPSPTMTYTPTITSTPTVSPTITPTLGIGSTRVRESDGMVQVYVPEGEFTMGDDSPWPINGPKHQVYLDDFWIDQTEITNAQFMACIEAGICEPPIETRSFRRAEYFGNSKYDDYPVIFLGWKQAKTYCGWVGADLPTEAQWEKAARGDDGRTFPWGNGMPEKKMVNGMYLYTDTVKVGSFPLGASPYGALDMAGNVSEWVNDCYDGKRYYEVSPYKNPPGPEVCENIECHVTRGGSWHLSIGFLCTYDRYPKSEDRWLPDFSDGFRCANKE